MNIIINKKIRKFWRRKIFSDLKKDKRDGCDAVKKKPLKINGLEVAVQSGQSSNSSQRNQRLTKSRRSLAYFYQISRLNTSFVKHDVVLFDLPERFGGVAFIVGINRLIYVAKVTACICRATVQQQHDRVKKPARRSQFAKHRSSCHIPHFFPSFFRGYKTTARQLPLKARSGRLKRCRSFLKTHKAKFQNS